MSLRFVRPLQTLAQSLNKPLRCASRTARPVVQPTLQTQPRCHIANLHTSTQLATQSSPAVSSTEPPRDSPKGAAAFEGIDPVELAFDVVQPAKVKKGNEGQCLVICHGLLYVLDRFGLVRGLLKAADYTGKDQ